MWLCVCVCVCMYLFQDMYLHTSVFLSFYPYAVVSFSTSEEHNQNEGYYLSADRFKG